MSDELRLGDLVAKVPDTLAFFSMYTDVVQNGLIYHAIWSYGLVSSRQVEEMFSQITLQS